MTTRRSTKYCNASLTADTTDTTVFTHLQLRIFSGTPPTTADAAETDSGGKLLLVITEPSYAALTFDTAADGILAKSANAWSGTAGDTDAGTGSSATTKITSGTETATWFRYCSKSDTGSDDTSSKSRPRLQGSIATAGAELELSSTSITFGASHTVTYAILSKTPS